MQWRALEIEHVHADLHSARPRELEPDRLHARHAAARLADCGGDRAGHFDGARREVDVVGDERPPRADEHCARARVDLERSELRHELARVHPPPELVEPAPPEKRRSPPPSDLAVEEHREPDVTADRLG